MANPSTSYFSLTGDNVIDSLTNGYRWSLDGSRTVDYSISGGFSGEFWNAPATVAQYMGAALSTFSYYANINFNYVGSFSTPTTAGQAGSEINLSLDGANRFFSSTNSWAIGFFPSPTYAQYQAGDIFLNLLSAANTLPSYEPGSKGWFVLLHELGHTLGLKHPHDSGGTGRPTFAQVGELSLDKDIATIMSYNDDASWNQFGWNPATPMILDVLALQALYGKNQSTNAGNSTFQLTQTNFYTTLWDASGIDTLDASASNTGWTIYLPNKAFATLVDTKVGIAAPTSDFALAVPRTVQWLAGDYENVIGSQYDDVIICNDLNNTITCNGGNDQVDGGNGVDTVIFSNARSGVNISFSNGAYTIINPNGTVTVKNVENFSFSGVNYSASSLLTPTYIFKSGVSSVDEGGSGYTYWIHTTGLSIGAEIDYSISGIDASRLTIPLTGKVKIDGGSFVTGYAGIVLGFVNNNHTDGPTTILLSIASGAATYSIQVNDTSLSPINLDVNVSKNIPYYVSQSNLKILGTEIVDKVILPVSSNNSDITIKNSVVTIKDNTGNLGITTLNNIERLQFTNTTIALDIGKDQTAGSGYMLYKAAFNRTPDVGGLGYWISKMDAGVSYSSVAQSFVNSAEFKTAFGGSNPSVNTLVTKLYNNVLNRTPDAGGLAFWQDKLNTGWSTADVLGYFSTSGENVTNVTPLIANGIQYKEWVG
jgi:serralysin